ncbi:hypothetical protein [Bradyrhizobium sp.]|uniref:hypothetical protein n=1 Tax=Bradyrhizobium sp. TaxID=376 RepID=UPI0025B9B231|nr:hypothetical protein [Bradyrhizobium sp.]MCA3254803.1 hypothetical protein [Alphaproteobacteria bacterium]MCA3566275.1 hypothetical protein [Bradyrhizobium sp.]
MSTQDLATFVIVGAAVGCGFVATAYALRNRRLPNWFEVLATLVLTVFASAHMLGFIAR